MNLFDPSGKLTATAKWANADMGSALHLQVAEGVAGWGGGGRVRVRGNTLCVSLACA